MVQPTAFRPEAILACLVRHAVEFIVIGGQAGVAQGAGWATMDVDVVVEESGANLELLLSALTELAAEYDTFHTPPVRPHLSLVVGSHGPQLFRTRYGRLDVLKKAGGETYESLMADAVEARLFGATFDAPASLRCFA